MGENALYPPTPNEKILMYSDVTRHASDTILWKLLALKLRFRDMMLPNSQAKKGKS